MEAGPIKGIEVEVARAAQEAGLMLGKAYPKLVNTWRSRTATLYRFRLEESACNDLVVKLLDRPEDARVLFHSMEVMADALEGFNDEEILVLRPLGFNADLGMVIMPHVSGRPLTHLLQQYRLPPNYVSGDVVKHINRCGMLLAKYHGKLADHSGSSRKVAWDLLEQRILEVLGPRSEIREVTSNGMVAQSYGDFHAGHIIITDSKKLTLLDPPIKVRPRYVYRDLGLFVYNLFMNLVHPRMLRRGAFRIRHHSVLVKAFLGGYGSEMGRPLSYDDLFFINGCEAYFLKRRLSEFWATHSYPLLAYHLVPMRYRLFQLRQAMLRYL